jgi:hypothetical protein
MLYQLVKSPSSEEIIDMIKRVIDHAYIPFDPANTDYQEYLAWLAEGNEPLPADQPETTE